MKRISALSQLLVVLISISSCRGQSKAMEDQEKANEILATLTPKGLPPSSRIYMKAKVNGKNWEAENLFPDPDPISHSYRVNAVTDGVRIDFYVDIAKYQVGATHRFSEQNVANYWNPNDDKYYGGRSGSYILTELDNDGFEVSFHFTATANEGTGSVFDVTDGTLRFPFPAKKS